MGYQSKVWQLWGALSKCIINIGVFLRRILKGAILFLWIIFLVYSAGWAARGKASIEFIDFFENALPPSETIVHFKLQPSEDMTTIASGTHYLNQYRERRSRFENPVPISPVLDRLVPNWQSRFLVFSQRLEINPHYVEQEHYAQFSKIEERLRAISVNQSIDPKSYKIGSDVLIHAFSGPTFSTEDYPLPLEVLAWIEEDRSARQFLNARAALIDTFLLLIVLGALGSLIFLTRDYISKESATPLAAYFFRPVLGMFLAMAIFTLDMLAHAIISKAGILEVRTETLYVLAFSAGLLSEQTYAAVSARAESALARFKEKHANTGQQGTGAAQ